MLVQRSGVVANKITMVGALTAAWGTNPWVRDLFFGSFALFIGSTFVVLAVYAVIDHGVILPGEQGYTQEQAHTAERSPLKRDTEELLDRGERLPRSTDAPDSGGDQT